MIYFAIIVSILVVGILLNILSNNLVINYYEKASKIDSKINKKSHELIVFFITIFNQNTKVCEFSTHLDNSYNINRKIIFLSEDVFNSSSVGAITIAMHEFGHAVQHQNKSSLFYLYYIFSVLNKISSILILPAIIFLVVSLFLETILLKISLIIIIILYLFNLISRIIIIPLEQDASNKALKLLKKYEIFDKNELKIAKKLLSLACFTYVGGFFKSYKKIFKKILRGF
ncbi:MAG: zinc metallopeptidase [Christensenellales bacterium]